MTTLTNFMIPSADLFTLTEDYRIYIESLTGWLRENSTSNIISIQPEVGYLHRADLTTLLLENNVAIEDHYLILRVNGLTSPDEFDETVTSLIIPDQALISRMKSAYRTRLS